MQAESLPYVDEHATVLDVHADRAWPALLATVDALSSPAAAAYARVVGCDPATASGPRPLADGSTLPGFRVTRAVPGEELVLVGRHHFSSYALLFRLEPAGADACRLVAQTRARFPGLHGALYRAVVIRSGAHVLAVRRMLAGVRRAAA